MKINVTIDFTNPSVYFGPGSWVNQVLPWVLSWNIPKSKTEHNVHE